MLQSKINVLIAEDDQRLCQLINISVMKAGMETGMVYNGSAVIPRLKSSTWDLLLLDLMLPGKPGLQVLSTRPTNKELELWDFSFLL
jgi:DNA-binding response OmpR family regulator